jgi:hypothetical protein
MQVLGVHTVSSDKGDQWGFVIPHDLWKLYDMSHSDIFKDYDEGNKVIWSKKEGDPGSYFMKKYGNLNCFPECIHYTIAYREKHEASEFVRMQLYNMDGSLVNIYSMRQIQKRIQYLSNECKKNIL